MGMHSEFFAVHLKLTRYEQIEDTTFGALTFAGLELHTLEDAWRNNAPQISCIPPGVYTIQRVVSPHFGLVFEVLNVPGRSHILIHSGNTRDDTRGCILLGMKRGRLQNKPAVFSSRIALGQFMNALSPVENATLEIVSAVYDFD